MKTLGEIAYEAFVKETAEPGYCTSCASWEQVSVKNKRVFEAIGRAVARTFVHMPYREVVKILKEVK